MQTLILQHGQQAKVFNEECTRRLALANQVIRLMRTRCDIPDVSAVYIDQARPLILLHAEPPKHLLGAANGITSRRQPDGLYAVRCYAFEVEWGWISTYPAVHSAPRPYPRLEFAA